MSLTGLINALACCISDDSKELDGVLMQILTHINVASLPISSDELYSLSSTLTSLLGALLTSSTQKSLAGSTVHTVKNISLTMMRHITSLKQPIIKFYELELLISLLEVLAQTFLLLKKLYIRPLQTIISYIIQYSSLHVQLNSVAEDVEEGSRRPTTSPLETCYSRLTVVCTELLSSFPIKELQPVLVTIAMGTPYISDCKELLKVFAYHLVISLMFTFEPDTQTLLDINGTYLSFLIPAPFFLSIKHKYSIELSESSSSGAATINLGSDGFMHELLSLFKQYCTKVHYKIDFLKSKKSNPWQSFQYYLTYFLYTKGIYLDETNLIANFDQTRIAATGLLKRTTKAYTQSIRQLFDGDLISLSLICTMLRENNPVIMFLQPYFHILEYIFVFGDRVSSVKQLNVLYNLISEKLSALTQNTANLPLLVEGVIITFYMAETLLLVTAEAANYCLCPQLVQLFEGDPRKTNLKTPSRSGSCTRIASRFFMELDVFLQIIMPLLFNDQHTTEALRTTVLSALSSALFYSSILSFVYGSLHTYPFALGILGPYCKTIPLFIELSELDITKLCEIFNKEHSFTNLTKVVRDVYDTLSKRLITQGYVNTNHLKNIIYGMTALFFHRCFTVQFFLKAISLSVGQAQILHLNDLPVLSVKAIIERSPLMSYISKARLISQLYLLLMYGYIILDQFIMVYFYSRKYHDTLQLTCLDFFSIISDELTRCRMLETNFGQHGMKVANQVSSSIHHGDLALEDLYVGDTMLCTSDVYSSLAYLRAESALTSATETIIYTPQNWSALLFGSRTLKQLMNVTSGLKAFSSHISALLQRPDIFSFTYAILLICEVLCCDAGKLYGYFTFPLNHEDRLALMGVLRSFLELLVGNFTDISVTSELQYSLSSSPNGSSTEFVVGLLTSLEMVCQPILQDITPILLNRIALIKASIYKTEYEELSRNLLVQPSLITGVHQLIDWTVSNSERATTLIVSPSCDVQCPFHSLTPDLSLHKSLARVSYNYTLCPRCASDIASYKLTSAGCHYVRIVSLCDIFSRSMTAQFHALEEQSNQLLSSLSYNTALSQASEQGYSLLAAINLKDFSVKLYGSLDIRIAMKILSKLCNVDALSSYTTLLAAVVSSTSQGSCSWLGTLAHLHGNILRALFFSHAAALSTLETSKSTESDKAQWAKTLVTADTEMQKCATQLLPAFIGAWRGLLDPKYNLDSCTHLLRETLRGAPVREYECIQPDILELYRLLMEVVSLAIEPMKDLSSVSANTGKDSVFSLTILGLMGIPRGGASDLDLIIVSLTLIVGLLSDLSTFAIPSASLASSHLTLQLKDSTNAVAALHSLHLTLFSLPFSQVYDNIAQTPAVLGARQTLDSVIAYGCRYFSTLLTSPEAAQELSTVLFASDASKYFLSCVKIAYILRKLSQGSVKVAASTVVLNTDSAFYRLPFDHSPLFVSETIVSRIHAGAETKVGPQRRFLIDPLGDLKRTRERMKGLMLELPGNWDGLLGKAEEGSTHSRQPLALLKETADGVFFFAGHGCGEAVLPLNSIAELQQLPFCLFMGCSSLSHIPVGHRYEVGTYQYYSSSPLMLGTLWDGISGELDNITAHFMKQWTKGEKGLYSCLADAIAESSLRYLVGYSIIIIGDPNTKYMC
ncbi:Separase [Giardia lamblia P15]|uniref:separase n=1 Tax=Giardia intestinalis (strain P15) TaxID=658858 RepID=E1F5D7_GIAIA|nr:Separase [Giardia lamblia P15]